MALMKPAHSAEDEKGTVDYKGAYWYDHNHFSDKGAKGSSYGLALVGFAILIAMLHDDEDTSTKYLLAKEKSSIWSIKSKLTKKFAQVELVGKF